MATHDDPTKPDVQRLFDALGSIVEALEPLTNGARARMLLFVALQLEVQLSDAELQQLLEQAKQP